MNLRLTGRWETRGRFFSPTCVGPTRPFYSASPSPFHFTVFTFSSPSASGSSAFRALLPFPLSRSMRPVAGSAAGPASQRREARRGRRGRRREGRREPRRGGRRVQRREPVRLRRGAAGSGGSGGAGRGGERRVRRRWGAAGPAAGAAALATSAAPCPDPFSFFLFAYKFF